MEQKIYLILSFLLLLSTIQVFICDNAVYSVLFLILNFCLSALILLTFKIEFLGLLFIMVYVGAVAVLFLFVIMMIDTKKKSSPTNNLFFKPFYYYQFYCLSFYLIFLNLHTSINKYIHHIKIFTYTQQTELNLVYY